MQKEIMISSNMTNSCVEKLSSVNNLLNDVFYLTEHDHILLAQLITSTIAE